MFQAPGHGLPRDATTDDVSAIFGGADATDPCYVERTNLDARLTHVGRAPEHGRGNYLISTNGILTRLFYTVEEQPTRSPLGDKRHLWVQVHQLNDLHHSRDIRTIAFILIACEAILVYAAYTRISPGDRIHVANPLPEMFPGHEWLTLLDFGYPAIEPWNLTGHGR